MIQKTEYGSVNVGTAAERLQWLFPPSGDTSTIVIECYRGDYSASRIARAVEDANAHLLNLNVAAGSGDPAEAGMATVELRVNLRNAMPAVRSLERYGFTVVSSRGADGDTVDDTLQRRVNELLRISTL